MSSYLAWKEKIFQSIEEYTNKDGFKIFGVGAFMVGAFLAIKLYNNQRGPSIMRIQQISQNILKSLEKAQISRQPLILEEQHVIESNQMTMKYILASKLREKQKNNNEQVRNPFLPPFQEGLFITQMGQSHRLLFNKYNIYQKHMLVVTKQFQPQSNLLNRQDFRQTILAFRAVRGLYFYNSGDKAGASQNHKHIQIFPTQARDLPIFRSILEYSRELKHQFQQKTHFNPEVCEIHEYPPFNFRHGFVLIGNDYQNQSQNDKGKQSSKNREDNIYKLKDNTLKAYERLYKHFTNKSNLEDSLEYNLIGCQHFLIMIPRRKERAFGDISVNAVGFMGSLLFKDKNLLRKYLNQERLGHHILQDITFPKSKLI